MNEQIPSIALIHKVHNFFAEIKGEYKEINLVKLRELRERMVLNGFNAPFKALLKRTYSEGNTQDENEIQDIKKQIRYFRQVAILKKGALKRADMSIAAHLLAGSFLKMGYGDILDNLPFDGNYIDFLFNSGVDGVRIYRELMDIMEERGKTLPIYRVEVFFKGVKYNVKIKNKAELEHKIAMEFGPEAQIMNIRVGKKEYPIIKSKSIRVALLSSIVSYLVKGEKEKDKKERRKELTKNALGLFLAPIFRFYLTTSAQERKKNNLYYSLTNIPNSNQTKLFNVLKELEPEFKNAAKILDEKLSLEKKIKIPSKLLGAGILKKHTNKEEKWIAEYLKIKEDEVTKGIDYLEAYSKEGKGAEFLEHLE